MASLPESEHDGLADVSQESRIRSGTVAPIDFTVVSHAAKNSVAPIMMRMPEPAPSARDGASASIHRGHVLLAVTRPRIDEKVRSSVPRKTARLPASCFRRPLHASRFTVDLRQVQTLRLRGEAQDQTSHAATCARHCDAVMSRYHGRLESKDRTTQKASLYLVFITTAVTCNRYHSYTRHQGIALGRFP
jgi:hypothetical protein